MPINLKPHNIETYGKIKDNFKRSKKVAVIQPPGTGKSYLALKLLEESKGKRAVYLAPNNTILHNLKRTIFEQGMDTRDFSGLKRVTYSKLMRMSDEEIEKLGADIVILDEFHHCGAPEWGNGVNRLLGQNLDADILGLSATPIRYFDKARDMAEELFNGNVASEMTLEEAIEKGILPEATYVSALYSYNEQLDQMEQNIQKISNSSSREEAQKLFNKLKGRLEEDTQNLPSLFNQYMKNKNGKYIIFCRNIEDMEQKMQVAQEMFGSVNPNITTYSISSRDGDIRKNDRTLTAFEEADNDTLKLMFSVNMLNEGYHIKDLDGVVMMRPTFSPTIFEQQLGRALSVKGEEGTPPVVLDLVNNFDSCKIIEDFCERMKQLGKGDGTRSVAENDRLSIFDKTKEFREIASKITELCKRTKGITLDEKIEIFQRFKETGEEITGQTIFEGYPIGQWGVQIRNEVNRGRKLSEKQADMLGDMGILERKFDSTIDEKIQALIKWAEQYPKAKVKYLGNDVLRQYTQSEEELRELEEQYEKIKDYYDYVRARRSNGKLSAEQEIKCKEGNIQGVFGYPTKTEELSRYYRITPDKIDYIFCKYGSMENYIKAYRENGSEYFENDGPLKDNIVKDLTIDVVNGSKKGHLSYLGKALLAERPKIGYETITTNGEEKTENDYDTLPKRDVTFLDGILLEETLETLNERERDVLRYRFGLEDGKFHLLDDTSTAIGLTRERVRQTENKAIRKIRAYNRTELFQIYSSKLEKKMTFTPEEETRRVELFDKIYNSNLIFIPDREYSEEPDSISPAELKEIASELREIQKSHIEETKTVQGLPIEGMDLSFRSFNVLKRAGITTMEQLRATPIEELARLRHMGSKSLEEIQKKLNEFGQGTSSGVTTVQEDTAAESTTLEEEKSSSTESTELEKLRITRDQLSNEVDKLRQQTKDAEQLLAKYNQLLGIEQNDKTPNSEGE